MRFLDWWLLGCAVVSGGAAGYLSGHTRRLVAKNSNLARLAEEGFQTSDDWWSAHAELDERITRAHTVATNLGQTDIVAILNGETT